MGLKMTTLLELADAAQEVSDSRTFYSTQGFSKQRETAAIKYALATGDAEFLQALIRNGMDSPIYLVAAAIHGLRHSGITDYSQQNIDSRMNGAEWVSSILAGRNNLTYLDHDRPTDDNLIHYAAKHPEKVPLLIRAIRSGVHTTAQDIIETVEMKFNIAPVLHDGVL